MQANICDIQIKQTPEFEFLTILGWRNINRGTAIFAFADIILHGEYGSFFSPQTLNCFPQTNKVQITKIHIGQQRGFLF